MDTSGQPTDPGKAVRDKLALLQRGAEAMRAAELDDELRSLGPTTVLLYWHLDPPLVSYVGNQLTDLDRESRRATALVLKRRERGELAPEDFAPYDLVRAGQGGFSISDAGPGSIEFLLQAIGLTHQVLMSDPVQFALTLATLLGWSHDVVVKIRDNWDLIGHPPSLREVAAGVRTIREGKNEGEGAERISGAGASVYATEITSGDHRIRTNKNVSIVLPLAGGRVGQITIHD